MQNVASTMAQQRKKQRLTVDFQVASSRTLILVGNRQLVNVNFTVCRRALRIKCLCVVSESFEQLANSHPWCLIDGLKSNQMTDDLQIQSLVAVTAVQWRARNACLIKFR